jgi:hypothetical protein
MQGRRSGAVLRDRTPSFRCGVEGKDPFAALKGVQQRTVADVVLTDGFR